MSRQVTMLMILDGYGENSKKIGNAINNANKPNLDKLMATCPKSKICASGEKIGLPKGQMGNSEVGHKTIGAGRVINNDLTRITKSIEDGDFFSIPELVEAVESCKKNNKKLHIIGLLSDGGVHSHQRHLDALLELAKRKGMDNVFVHCFMDGRDSLPASGESYIQTLEETMKDKGVGKIATISGRFYAMDRENRWQRIQKVYNAIVLGKGLKNTSAIQAIEASYQKEVFDEFVEPTVICNGDNPIATVDEGDSIIFFNYRSDRIKQLTKAFEDPQFSEFKTKKMNINIVTLTNYDDSFTNVNVAFKKIKLINTLGEYLSKKKIKQLRITESERYSHITSVFNGETEKMYPGEDRILIPSPKVDAYDSKPEMSTYKITEKVIESIKSEKYDIIILNFANIDIVGHTGNIAAAEKAIEVVDECIGKIIDVLEKRNGICLITSNHGNAEQMIDYKTGEPYTSHTTNPVPLIIYGMENIKLNDGNLCDLAPTILDIMGLAKPKEMTGMSLLVRN